MVRTVSRLVSKILATRMTRGTIAAAHTVTLDPMCCHTPNQNNHTVSLEYLTESFRKEGRDSGILLGDHTGLPLQGGKDLFSVREQGQGPDNSVLVPGLILKIPGNPVPEFTMGGCRVSEAPSMRSPGAAAFFSRKISGFHDASLILMRTRT